MNRLYLTAATALLLPLVFAAGCTSERRIQAAMARPGDETPPACLTGPMLTTLVAYEGFSADLTESAPGSNSAATASGELIGRQGRVIFQPWTTANVKKGKFYRGAMSFIWDIGAQTGWVLSEALQGFAPVSFHATVTNQTLITREAASESVNGHSCHRCELMFALSDGTSARVIEWQADDLKRFPVRLRSVNAAGEMTVDFSNVRFDLPKPDLFSPPAGFTKYADSQALIGELMVRESRLRSGPTGPMAAPVETPENPVGTSGPSQP